MSTTGGVSEDRPPGSRASIPACFSPEHRDMVQCAGLSDVVLHRRLSLMHSCARRCELVGKGVKLTDARAHLSDTTGSLAS